MLDVRCLDVTYPFPLHFLSPTTKNFLDDKWREWGRGRGEEFFNSRFQDDQQIFIPRLGYAPQRRESRVKFKKVANE